MSNYREKYKEMERAITGTDERLEALPTPVKPTAVELSAMTEPDRKKALETYEAANDAFVANAMNRPVGSLNAAERSAIAQGIRAALRESAD